MVVALVVVDSLVVGFLYMAETVELVLLTVSMQPLALNQAAAAEPQEAQVVAAQYLVIQAAAEMVNVLFIHGEIKII
jgi:hypothetical protein